MKTNTREAILSFIVTHASATPKQLQEALGIGAVATHRQLLKLQEAGQITKIGAPPRVFYILAAVGNEAVDLGSISVDVVKVLDREFLYISPTGIIFEGKAGFVQWCNERNLPIGKAAKEYIQTLQKYHKYILSNGLIDGMPKMKATFDIVYLDEVYYLDFYAMERFGKTKLGSLLLYAKQSQSRELLAQLFRMVIPRIDRLAKQKKIKSLTFVPPTVKRTVQLQKELEGALQSHLPRTLVYKVSNDIPVPQKTLSRLEDRIANARASMIIPSQTTIHSPVLVIDDSIGSGASMNELAAKIKQISPKAKVIGLALTGSFKGFDVLQEV
jgi:hypothetical protein